ncbi:MAG: CDP-alcohol phosphatidyltransferase family protein [Anaerolineales bacterium]|nr:CDP-alcohol phosphatidyltransferase family protein [Anaerolineales bacterium]
MAGFLFGPTPTGLLAWAPAILYTMERLIDFADGYVARVTRRETRLGEILDIEFDGLGILVAVALGIQYGKLPFWYLLLGLGRQLFILGIWLRERSGKPVFPLPPSDNRRVIAGFQTGFITVVLWPIWTAQITLLASYVFAIPLIFSFGRDWLVVSGVLDANSAAYAAARRKGKQIIEGWLPLGARILAALLAVGMLAQIMLGVLYGDGASWPVLGVLLLVALAIGGVLLGAAGRVAALIVAAFAAMDIVATGMQIDNATLLVCAIIVLHLGSGRFALWRPEERPLHSKLGAQSPGSE